MDSPLAPMPIFKSFAVRTERMLDAFPRAVTARDSHTSHLASLGRLLSSLYGSRPIT